MDFPLVPAGRIKGVRALQFGTCSSLLPPGLTVLLSAWPWPYPPRSTSERLLSDQRGRPVRPCPWLFCSSPCSLSISLSSSSSPQWWCWDWHMHACAGTRPGSAWRWTGAISSFHLVGSLTLLSEYCGKWYSGYRTNEILRFSNNYDDSITVANARSNVYKTTKEVILTWWFPILDSTIAYICWAIVAFGIAMISLARICGFCLPIAFLENVLCRHLICDKSSNWVSYASYYTHHR